MADTASPARRKSPTTSAACPASSARSARRSHPRGRRPRSGGDGRLRRRRQRAGFHIAGVNWGRDLPEPEVADIRNVSRRPRRGRRRTPIARGIEVGHVFQLGASTPKRWMPPCSTRTARPR
jgi:hypothetical protein